MADYTGQVSTNLTCTGTTYWSSYGVPPGEHYAFQTFPLSPTPEGFVKCSFSSRNGVFYLGDDVQINFSASVTADYEIRNFYGSIAATGSITGTTLNLGSDWSNGWYRLYLTGDTWNTKFGYSLGASMFCVIRKDHRFPLLPATTIQGAATQIPTGGSNGAPLEAITRSCLGLGPARLSIEPTWSVTGSAGSTSVDACVDYVEIYNEWMKNSDYARPQFQWVAFPSGQGAYKIMDYAGPFSNNPNWATWIHFFIKDSSKDGSQIYVKVENGSSSGWKVTIRYPDSATIVETYDNLPNDCFTSSATINASSNYVKACGGYGDYPVGIPYGPTAIGDDVRQGLVAAAQTLYPLGVEFFEGPVNEPGWSSQSDDYWHQILYLFQAHLKEGNPNAKVMGPVTVNLGNAGGFIENGLGQYYDAISFHDYNTMPNGDMNIARHSIEGFLDILEENGQADKVLWQTEANFGIAEGFFSVHYPRAGAFAPAHTIMWEQYGIPFERNPLWYDYSHGFWDFCSWMFNGDNSPASVVPLMCTYAQEVFGKNFHHRLDFGSIPANHIFFGNVYGDARKGSVAAFLCTTQMLGSNVIFKIWADTLPENITIIDCFGNESLVSSTGGTIRLEAKQEPTYIRLPAGVNISVQRVNDWDATVNVAGVVASSAYFSDVLTNVSGLYDGTFMEGWTGAGSPGIYQSPVWVSPDKSDCVTVLFNQDTEVERVLLWSWAGQMYTALLDFDIQTFDGTSWTTRTTWDEPSYVASIKHGADSSNSGSEMESYFSAQTVHDIPLDPPVTCRGIRVYVRKVTAGGDHDVSMIRNEEDLILDAHPNSRGVPRFKISLSEIQILSPTTVTGGPGVPSNTKAPSIETLDPKVGTQLSCLPGRWSPLATSYTYQWQVSDDHGSTWSDLADGTDSHYIIKSDDTGKLLRCAVQAHTSSGVSSANNTTNVLSHRKYVPIGSV